MITWVTGSKVNTATKVNFKTAAEILLNFKEPNFSKIKIHYRAFTTRCGAQKSRPNPMHQIWRYKTKMCQIQMTSKGRSLTLRKEAFTTSALNWESTTLKTVFNRTNFGARSWCSLQATKIAFTSVAKTKIRRNRRKGLSAHCLTRNDWRNSRIWWVRPQSITWYQLPKCNLRWSKNLLQSNPVGWKIRSQLWNLPIQTKFYQLTIEHNTY